MFILNIKSSLITKEREKKMKIDDSEISTNPSWI
jgi:hypothetical protein